VTVPVNQEINNSAQISLVLKKSSYVVDVSGYRIVFS